MVTHVDRDDLLVLNKQLQRDATGQVDGHRMQTLQLATQHIQTKRWMRGFSAQQLERLEIGTTRLRMLLQKLGGAAVVLLCKKQAK